MKLYITVTELWRVQEFFLTIFKVAYLRKGEQSFLCGTRCLDLVCIHIKYLEDCLRTDRQMDGQSHAII